MLTSYTNVSATNLTCTTVSSVEAKLVPKLASGSGPSGPVKESVSRITFKCVVALHLVPNRLTGSGKCTATNDRSFTFVATVSGQ